MTQINRWLNILTSYSTIPEPKLRFGFRTCRFGFPNLSSDIRTCRFGLGPNHSSKNAHQGHPPPHDLSQTKQWSFTVKGVGSILDKTGLRSLLNPKSVKSCESSTDWSRAHRIFLWGVLERFSNVLPRKIMEFDPHPLHLPLWHWLKSSLKLRLSFREGSLKLRLSFREPLLHRIYVF